MVDTVRVRPWPGLILAEVPNAGAELPRALAEEWIDNHLVVRVTTPTTPTQPGPAEVHPKPRRSKR